MHTQVREMRWILNQFSRRRIDDEAMATARALMPVFVQQTGDMKKAAKLAMEASYALIDVFVEEELI